MKARSILFFYTIPQLALTLGAGLVGKLTVLVLMWYLIFRNQIIKTKQSVRLPLFFAGQKIPTNIYDTTHIAALKEVYLDQEYDWCPVEKPKCIVDIGAHIGDTALYYHARFPDATIIAVEPSPENFALLQKNCQDIKQIKTVYAAVSNVDGILKLNIGPSSLGYSVKNRTDIVNSVQVPAITLATLFANHAVTMADVIKFDIEGGEEHLFPTESSPQQFARVYIGEIHTDLMDMSKEAFLDLFKEFGINTETSLSDHRFILKASYHVND